MIKSKMISLYNNIHFFVIPIIFIILSFHYYIFLLPLIVYLIYIYKRKIFFKAIFIISLLFGTYYSYFNFHTDTTGDFKGIVIEKENTDKNYKLTVTNGVYKAIVYTKIDSIEVGDVALFSGNLLRLDEESYEGGFSYKDYLKSKKIFKTISMEDYKKYTKIYTPYNLRYSLSNYFNNKYDSTTSVYLNAFILGINKIDSTTRDDINSIGISHLFCISGYHVNILYFGISFILLKIIKKDNIVDNILIVFLLLYIFLCGFTVSVFRASIMLIITILVKKFNLLFTKLDILSLTLLLTVMINPLALNQSGAVLTFILAFFLITSSKISDNKVKSAYITSFLCFLASLPIVINMNNEVNILSIIYTPIFMVLIGYILIPYTYIIAFIPFINIKIINGIEWLMNMLARIDVFTIRIPDLNIYFIIIYYILLLCFLIGKRKKRIFSYILLFLFFISNIRVIRWYSEVTMINVGQGDSILISLSHNRGNMLIDSFGYNVEYLKDIGIKKLDYLVLTHSDLDHTQTALDVINNFEVKEVVGSIFTDIEYITKYVESGDNLFLDNIKVECLGPIRNSNNINDISVVLKIIIEDVSFLFTGDMELSEELDLIDKYKDRLSSDILKLGHHGSNSSTGELLLKYVNPSIGLISVGVDNKFSHPSLDVLNRCRNIDIYRTDINKNVVVRVYKNKFEIKAYK